MKVHRPTLKEMVIESAKKIAKNNHCGGVRCENCPLSMQECWERETRGESAALWLEGLSEKELS